MIRPMKSIAALSLISVSLLAPALCFAQAIPESVYPPPEPYTGDDVREMQTGFRFKLDTRYMSDYVWRGTVDVAAIRIWLRDPAT